MTSSHQQPSRSQTGFSLIELMVAVVILLIVMIVLFQMAGGVGNLWSSSRGKISAFQNARAAFETIGRTLSRATLNTYNDYVDASGNFRTATNSTNFLPAKFMRASELHFLTGPSAQIVPGADATKNPGDAVFFQVAAGYTDTDALKGLRHAVNSMGFFVTYSDGSDASLPEWLKSLAGSTKRFKLIQLVEPTENLQVYRSTAQPGYDLAWLNTFSQTSGTSSLTPRVLAENIPLFLVRPRLSPEYEKVVAPGLGSTYSDATRGSILSPNYHYDSRAWMNNYPSGQRVTAASAPAARANIMRNQVPQIVDLVMVSVDPRSLSRFDLTSALPPAPLRVPAELFTDSSKLESDLELYSKQLSDAQIRFRIFRLSIPLAGAKWFNN
jgi:uncharacterized protein (TIGR02599 family)